MFSKSQGLYNPVKNIETILADVKKNLCKTFGEVEGTKKANELFNPDTIKRKFIGWILADRENNTSIMSSLNSTVLYKVLHSENTLFVKLESIREYTADPENRNKKLYESIRRAEQQCDDFIAKHLNEVYRQVEIKNDVNGFLIINKDQYDPVANIEHEISVRQAGENKPWYMDQFISLILQDRAQHKQSFFPSKDSSALITKLSGDDELEDKLAVISSYTQDSANAKRNLYQSIQRAEKEILDRIANGNLMLNKVR